MSEPHIEHALEAGRLASEHGVDLTKLPAMLDLSAESITENVHAMNENCTHISSAVEHPDNFKLLGPDERMKFIFKNLVCKPVCFLRSSLLSF